MDVKNILVSAQNPDYNIRKWGEFYLNELEKRDFQKFIINLSDILEEESNEPHIRRLAGLILKNRLDIKRKNEKSFECYKWFDFDKKSVRETIKNKILNVFYSSSKIARRTASQVLAKIACIELSNDEQSNNLVIYSKLLEEKKRDVNFYHAVLETIEFICQETGSDKFPSENFKKYSVQVIKILLQAINESDVLFPDIKIAAINGLLSLVEFIEDIFKQQSYRSFIIESICAQARNVNVSIRALSFETLDKIAQNYYCWLENYVFLLFELTTYTIQNDSDLVILQAIEFWSTIADEEFELNIDAYRALNEGKLSLYSSCNYILQTSSYLPSLLLNCIRTRNKTEGVEEWNCCTAAGACLNIMCQASPREIIYSVICFIDSNILDNNLYIDVECVTLVFVAIFDGIGSKVLYGYVRKMVEFWFIYIGKSTTEVKDIIILTIGKISNYFPCMIRYVLDRIIQIILTNIINKSALQNLYWCLNEILQSFGKEGIIDWCFEYIVSIIINKILSKTQNYKITNELFELFSSLIINSSVRSKSFIFVILPFFLLNFDLSIMKKKNKCLTNKDEIDKYLCRIISYFIQKYGEKINFYFIEKIIKLLYQLAFEINDNNSNYSLEEEILACIGAIVQIRKNKPLVKIKEWINFLLRCIDNTENIQNCSLAIGIIGDICRTMEKEIKPFIDQIIDELIRCLKKNYIDKELKPALITCLGDIMLIYGFKIKYFNSLIDLFQKMTFITKELFLDKNSEVLDLNLKINESILESITGIIQGYKDQKDTFNKKNFYERLKWIVKHLYDTISGDRIYRIVKICIGLMGDLSLSFEYIKKILKKEIWVFQILFESKINKEYRIRTLGIWAFESIFIKI